MHRFAHHAKRFASTLSNAGTTSTVNARLVSTVVASATVAAVAYSATSGSVAHAGPNFPSPDNTSILSYSSIASKINSTLSEAHRVDKIGRGRIDSVHIAQYNANANIEDTYAYKPQLSSDTGALFGVFDGHSGRAASAFCRDELLDYMDFYKATKNTDDVIAAKSIEQADQHFLSLAVRENRLKDGIAGACLIVSHFKDDVIRTASAGDCRGVVGRRIDENTQRTLPGTIPGGAVLLNPSPLVSSKIAPLELGPIHQIDLNWEEKERLLSGHPKEADVIRNDRVKGGLQPTRGFGDGTYKQMEFFLQRYTGNEQKRYVQYLNVVMQRLL